MLYERVLRGAPEQVFIVIYNSYATGALTVGQPVIWDFNDDVDGVGVTKPTVITTNQGYAAAGIVAETIDKKDYGLIQVYGFHSGVIVRAATSAEVIDKGTPLALAATATFCLESFVSDTGTDRPNRYPCALALEAYTFWTTKAIKAFVKCL